MRGRILVHLPGKWRFSVHSCVRGKIPVHFLEGWWFRCIHVWGVGYRCFYLRSDELNAFMCGIAVHMRDDDFGAFMCEVDSGAFTWWMMISVHSVSCVSGRIWVYRMFVHLPEEWRFAVHSCVRGKIPVHLLEGWWCRCIHVWGVGYRCIYLRSDDLRCIHVWGVRFRCIYLRDDDFGAFMCEG